jgi:hypothetical protein
MNDSGNFVLYKATATQLEITRSHHSYCHFKLQPITENRYYLPRKFWIFKYRYCERIFTSTAASGLFKGTIVTTADASGTLLVGPKTYANVLRIKSVQNFNLYQSTDTNYLSLSEV